MNSYNTDSDEPTPKNISQIDGTIHDSKMSKDFFDVLQMSIEMLQQGFTLQNKKKSTPPFTLEMINRQIYVCEQCALSKGRTHAVPGEGVHTPLVLVIGEGPGAKEDAQGRPFVGPAGQYLDTWLNAVGLSREKNVYITNVVKCRPPHNRDPHPNEYIACNKYLQVQITLLQPKIIFTVGRIATQILTDNLNVPISRLRTTIHTYHGIPLVATYHPSAVLRNKDQLRRPVWDDMQLLQRTLHDIVGEY